MARRLRLDFPGAIHHCMNRGNERRAIFIDDADRLSFMFLLAQTVERFGIGLYAFALMANHFHLLLQSVRGNLSEAMAWLESGYTMRFNRRHERVGHVYQGRYTSILVLSERQQVGTDVYISNNPVEAGLVVDAWEYAWSHCRSLRDPRSAPSWLNVNRTLELAGGWERYAELLGAPADDPSLSAMGGAILGAPEQVRGLLSPEVLEDENVAGRLDLGRTWTIEELLAMLAAAGIGLSELTAKGRHSEARGLGMFFLRRIGRLPLAEVAALCGVSRGAVSKRVAEIEGDVGLRSARERLASLVLAQQK